MDKRKNKIFLVKATRRFHIEVVQYGQDQKEKAKELL